MQELRVQTAQPGLGVCSKACGSSSQLSKPATKSPSRKHPMIKGLTLHKAPIHIKTFAPIVEVQTLCRQWHSQVWRLNKILRLYVSILKIHIIPFFRLAFYLNVSWIMCPKAHVDIKSISSKFLFVSDDTTRLLVLYYYVLWGLCSKYQQWALSI